MRGHMARLFFSAGCYYLSAWLKMGAYIDALHYKSGLAMQDYVIPT